MSLESPITYSEWYWKHGLDSRLAEQEQYEKELTPITNGVISGLNITEFLPESLSGLFAALQSPPAPALAGVLARFGSEVADGVVNQTLNHALQDFNYKMAEWFGDLRIDFPTASLLLQRKKITEELFESRAKSAGYKPAESAAAYDAMRPFPSIPEIMTWARYHGDFDNVRGKVWERFDVDVNDFDLWEWLSIQKLTTEQAQTLFKRGVLTELDFMAEIGRLGWHSVDRDSIKDLAYSIPNAMLLVQAGLVTGATNETIIEDISRADIHPDYAQKYLDAVMTKPASQDIVAHALRRDPNLSDVDQRLRRIGIHPDFTDVYKELAYIIPPVADIITMAVREAFSPQIAARFGQYEDFPAELAEWAGKKGLTKEWAERYWAAHWSLPSPQQGFEMLHRGVINTDELNLLLRASDVMPFWRDKLTQIAFRPLTRVDVRRMFREGVLNEQEVFESYLDQGYNDENAQRMTEFTVRSTLSSLAKFSTTDIVKAYTQRMIDRPTAQVLLRDIGVRQEDANYVLTTAEYKRQWAFTDEQISAIRNLYKKRIYDENAARDALTRLNLPSDQVNVLLQQWFIVQENELDATWTTAQTVKFFKRGLINQERALQELNLNGYNLERATVILRDAVWTPPQA